MTSDFFDLKSRKKSGSRRGVETFLVTLARRNTPVLPQTGLPKRGRQLELLLSQFEGEEKLTELADWRQHCGGPDKQVFSAPSMS